ncbi:ring-cleaving dioxygenase [Salegentibacter sp. F14]
MENKILGLHHITAIAGDPQKNYDFYTEVLGLRMVKKTVNFDDPQTYHFYFGDKKGSPGTILTFFPWPRAKKGKNGVGMATEIGYAVAEGSLEFWQKRFEDYNVHHEDPYHEFGEKVLPFQDPDGLRLKLIIPSTPDLRQGWHTNNISQDVAFKGFHSASLLLNHQGPTASILTDIFGYEYIGKEGNRYRYQTPSVKNASIIDLLEDPAAGPGVNAAGTNHHIAFRVKDEESQQYFRNRIVEAGLHITGKIDRDYFYSLYFREPGGVLFEIATDNPGFTRDESLEELGSSLKLPKKYESSRERIEGLLPKLRQ